MVIRRKNKKDINYYLNLPWSYIIETMHENEKLIYVVHVNELPRIATDAPSIDEAMSLIKEAMKGLFELYLENNEEIPEPIREIPENEKWLFMLENKESLEKIKEGLQQEELIDLGSFKKQK